MKKLIIIASAILALAACSKVEQPAHETIAPKTITLKAGIVNDETKLGWDCNTAGISGTFQVDDIIFLFDSEGNMTQFTATEVDANGVATFTGAPETEILEGAAITAVVKTAATSRSGDNVSINLNGQAGTLASAGAHTLMYASGTYSASGVSLMFEHKTSIIKFTLSLPDAETATSVNGFYLFTVDNRATVTDQNGEQFTYMNNVSVNALTGEVTNAKNGSGWISWTEAAEVTGHTVTLYLSVPAINLKNAALQCTPNSDSQKRYFWNIAGSSPLTIEAGKAYEITRTQTQFAPSAAGSTFFYSDDAQVYNFGLPQGDIVTYSTSTGDWLTKETDSEGNMQIRMTANTTGSPREATLIFKVFGAFCKYSVAQANPEDFAGDWNLNAKEFLSVATTKSITTEGSGSSLRYYDGSWAGTGRQTTNAKTIPVTVSYLSSATPQTSRESVSALVSGAVPKNDVTRTNNLSISGIYRNITLKSSVDINYSTHKATYGLFLDMNAASIQQISGGTYDGEYALFAPELWYASGTYKSKWEFGAGSLGAPNSIWWMGTLSVSGSTTTLKFGYQTQYLTTNTSYVLKICGLQLDRFNSSSPSAQTLIRTKSGSGSNANTGTFGYGAAYPQILQANYNNVENNGLQLVKTAAVATPAPIEATPVENTAW
jgi:hypothetical protein